MNTPIQEIAAHLGAAMIQIDACEDPIIRDHIVAAHALAKEEAENELIRDAFAKAQWGTMNRNEIEALKALCEGYPEWKVMLPRGQVSALIATVEELAELLKELHAMVWGECPGLLDEDSGGCARLDLDIRAVLAKLEGGE